jgi:hypothetical protein
MATVPLSVAFTLPAGNVQRSPAIEPALATAPFSNAALTANDCGVASVPLTVIATAPSSEIAVLTSTTFLPTRYLNAGTASLSLELRE